MVSNEDLRAKAARLMAMANKFRQDGQIAYADAMMTKAAECLEQVAGHSESSDKKRDDV